MELKELRQKSGGELHKLLAQWRENFRDLRFKISSKQHKNVREIREVKKTIARMLTVLKEKKVLQSFAKNDKPTPAKKVVTK